MKKLTILLGLLGTVVASLVFVAGPGAKVEAAGSWGLWTPLRGGADQWKVGCTWNQTDSTARRICTPPGYHGYKAIDIFRNPAKGSGGNVYAARSGSVHIESRGSGCGGPGTVGNVVRLRHTTEGGSTFYTYYRHLKDIMVSEGQSVSASTVIGHVGNTGYTYCYAHLHFEVMTSGGTKQSARLAACHGSRRLYYPYAYGDGSTYTDWDQVPYGANIWSDAITEC